MRWSQAVGKARSGLMEEALAAVHPSPSARTTCRPNPEGAARKPAPAGLVDGRFSFKLWPRLFAFPNLVR